MKVLVSVDLEGVAGVVDRSDIAPNTPGWERARELMTDEASAVVRGVFSAGAEAEVTVCDSHARGMNILPERLDPRARLIRGTPRPLDMVAGVDRGVDAVIFIGYHGRAGAGDAVLPHTLSGRTIDSVRIDGTVLGEIGLSAAVATSYGARTVLVTGDQAATAEAGEVVPGVATVTVKRSLGVRSADSVHPGAAPADSGIRTPWPAHVRLSAAEPVRRVRLGRPGGGYRRDRLTGATTRAHPAILTRSSGRQVWS